MSYRVFSFIRRLIHIDYSKTTLISIGITFLWQISNYVVPLLTLPYLARILGVYNFGIFSLATVVSSYGVLITDWGFALSGTQAVAAVHKQREQLIPIIWDIIIARLFLALTATIMAYFGLILFVTSPILSNSIAISMIILIPTALNLDWVLRGLENFKDFALTSVVGRLITIPLLLIFVHSDRDIYNVIIVQVFGSALTALLTVAVVWKSGLLARPSVNMSSAMGRVFESSSIFLSTASVNIYANSLPLILGLFAGSDAVGLYAGAERIRRAAANALIPLSLVIYPKIVKLIAKDIDKANDLAVKTLIIQTSFAAAMCLIGYFFAPWIVLFLLGSKFVDSAPLLRIMIFNLIPIGISGVLGLLIMVPFGYKRDFTISICFAGVLGTSLAVFLSYLYEGRGTAYASLITEVLIAATMYAVLYFRTPWLRTILLYRLKIFSVKSKIH